MLVEATRAVRSLGRRRDAPALAVTRRHCGRHGLSRLRVGRPAVHAHAAADRRGARYAAEAVELTVLGRSLGGPLLAPAGTVAAALLAPARAAILAAGPGRGHGVDPGLDAVALDAVS